MLLGLSCALAAALAYGAASVLQSVGVHRIEPGTGLFTGLRTQPLYFLGLALDGLGFVAAVVALQFLPLFLVQSVVASSVVVTAVIAAALGARIGASGWWGVAVVMCGLVLLGLSAGSEGSRSLPDAWRWVLVGCVLPVVGLGWWGRRRRHPALLAVAAGLAFSVVAVAARALHLPVPWWHVLADPSVWALALSGVAGAVLFAMAVEIGVVTRVSAVTFATETVLPSIVGVLALGDAVRPGHWPMAVLGFVMAVGGAISLSRFGEYQPTGSTTGAAVPPTA